MSKIHKGPPLRFFGLFNKGGVNHRGGLTIEIILISVYYFLPESDGGIEGISSQMLAKLNTPLPNRYKGT